MKVLVVEKPGQLRIVDMEKPVPGPDEILAKVAYCGICGTDVSIADGTLSLGDGMDPIYPVRIGHEWSGVVVEVGEKTGKLKVGDPVISETGWSCGACEACFTGRECENGKAIGTIGNCWPGGFAEYMLVPERIAHKVPANISLDEAALVEPAMIGFCGLERSCLGPGKTLLVVGTGPIGLGGLACARSIGCGKIILAGRKDKKLEIGKQLGADVLINTTRENLMDAVKEQTNGFGADVILDTTGDPKLFNDLLLMLRGGGDLVIPGFFEQPVPDAKLDRLITRNCRLIGAAGQKGLSPRILDMLSNGRLTLKPMITEYYDFEQAEEAFAAMKSHNDSRVKIMLRMN